MAVTQQSSLNSLFNTLYERARFVSRETNIMTNLVDNRTGAGWADRVVPVRPAITAVAVGETEDFAAPTTFGKSSLATITPGEVHSQVVLTKRAIETDPDPVLSDAAFELGGSVATKVDVDLVGLFSSFDTDLGAGAGNAHSIGDVADGISVLRNAKAPQQGQISAVWHPYHWHDIWVELGTPSANQAFLGDLANEALRNFWVMDYMATRHYISANISVDASDDAVSGMFVRRAIMFDVRRGLNFEDEYDPSARAWELNANLGYGYAVVHSDEGVYFTADATTPT